MGTFPKDMPDKRKVEDIPILVGQPTFIENLVAEIKRIEWPYVTKTKTKVKGIEVNTRDLLRDRDQALASFLSLIGPRINEALQFKKKEFAEEVDRVTVGDFQPEKHGNIRKGLWLPKQGPLAPLTEMFLKWFNEIPGDPEAFVFPTAKPFGVIRWNKPIESSRAHKIFNSTIGKFPHWYRGVAETIIGKLVFHNDPYKLKKFMGVKRIESVYPYVGEPWEQDLERYSKTS